MSKLQLDLKCLKDEFQGEITLCVLIGSTQGAALHLHTHQKKINKNYRLVKRALFAVIIACLWHWPSEVKRRAGRVGFVCFFSLQLGLFQPGVACRGFNDGAAPREGLGLWGCSGNHLGGFRLVLHPLHLNENSFCL